MPLTGVPEGAELWDIDGRVYLVYFVPGTTPPVPLGWHVEDLEELAGLGPDRNIKRRLSQQEAEREGFLHTGSRTDIVGIEGDPFDGMARDLEERARYESPAFADPGVLRVVAEAAMEGRAPLPGELAQTDYFRGRTDAEVGWEVELLTNPGQARETRQQTEQAARDALTRAGWPGEVPDSMARYVAEQYLRGRVPDLDTAARRETDPYDPSASPFAGRTLPEDARLVRQGEDYFVQTGRDAYRLTGPGQVARFGGPERANAVRPHEGFHVVNEEGRHFLKTTGDQKWWEATGPGQIRELTRIYGDPREVPNEHVGTPSGAVVDLYGGPNQLEKYAGAVKEKGTAADLAAQQPPLEGRSALGGEERVRQLVRQWLGPAFGDNYTPEWVAQWAGRIRANPQSEEQLVDLLRSQRLAVFPEYENEDLTYEDIAGPWRGMWQQEWGTRPDETDPLFQRVLRMNDAYGAQQVLRTEGLNRGVETVTARAAQDLAAAFGSNIIRTEV